MIVNKRFNESEFYNRVLWQSEHFKVIPSLGSLVEGWLLVIPKKHYICYGEITDSLLLEELNLLITYTCEIIKKEYGNYIIFEHGPIVEKSKVGCGVDYAHIHICPVNLPLEKIKEKADMNFNWQKVEGIASANNYYDSCQPYLYFQDVNFNTYIGTNKEIPSQFFRRLIASHIGKPAMFDWKANFLLDNIRKTFLRLGKYNESIHVSKLEIYGVC